MRILRVDEWNRLQDRLGATGTVLGCQPDKDNRGWTVCVEFADVDDCDDYREDQLESTGLVEVLDEAGALRDRNGEPAAL